MAISYVFAFFNVVDVAILIQNIGERICTAWNNIPNPQLIQWIFLKRKGRLVPPGIRGTNNYCHTDNKTNEFWFHFLSQS